MLPRRRTQPVALLLLLVSCAHPPSPVGVPPPPRERLIDPPGSSVSRVEAVGLLHLLRGIWYLKADRAAAAIAHLRMARIYDEISPTIHRHLALAWMAVGRPDRARDAVANGLKHVPDAPGLNGLAGRWALREQQYERALAHLEKAVAGSTRHLRGAPAGAYVDVLLWTKKRERALTWIDDLLTIHREADEWVRDAGHALEDHGLFDEAQQVYAAVCQQRPQDVAPALARARVLAFVGRYEEAAKSLIPLLAYRPEDVTLLLRVAQLLSYVTPEAASAYRDEALRLAADDPRYLATIAAAEVTAGRIDAAINYLAQFVRVFPEAFDERIAFAELLGVHGRPAACLEILEGLAAAEIVRSGCIADAHGYGVRLLRSLERAARASPRPALTLQMAARLLARQSDKRKARTALGHLLARLRGNVPADAGLLARATLLDLQGDGEAALTTMAELVETRDQLPLLLLYQADLEARYGDLSRAISILSKLVRDRPEDPVRLNALGFTLADAGVRLDEAAVWLHRAHRLASDQAFVVDSLGWLYFRQGKSEAALRLLRRAAATAPHDAEILRHLGDVLHALGNTEEARRIYQQALSTHPNAVLRRLIQSRLTEGT